MLECHGVPRRRRPCKVLLDRVVQLQFPALLQQQNAGARELLRDRSDAVLRRRSVRDVPFEIRASIRLVEHDLVAARHQHRTHELLGIDQRLDRADPCARFPAHERRLPRPRPPSRSSSERLSGSCRSPWLTSAVYWRFRPASIQGSRRALATSSVEHSFVRHDHAIADAEEVHDRHGEAPVRQAASNDEPYGHPIALREVLLHFNGDVGKSAEQRLVSTPNVVATVTGRAEVRRRHGSVHSIERDDVLQ